MQSAFRIPQEPIIIKFDPKDCSPDLKSVLQDQVSMALWSMIQISYNVDHPYFKQWCIQQAENIRQKKLESPRDLYDLLSKKQQVTRHLWLRQFPDQFSQVEPFFERLFSAIKDSSPIIYLFDDSADNTAPNPKCRKCKGTGIITMPDGFSDQGAICACLCLTLTES